MNIMNENSIEKMIVDIKDLVESIRLELIKDNDPEIESIDLTVAWDGDPKKWVFQTGDNSFYGSCYQYDYWAVVTVCPDTDSEELAVDIMDQLRARD